MSKERTPLIRDADEITAEWMRQALTVGGVADCQHIDALEIEGLSEVTNMMGSLYRCSLFAPGGAAAGPASVIVKMPGSNAMTLRLAKWLSLHRREYVFYRDIGALGRIRAPSLLYGDFDTRSHRFVLVLEDLAGMKSLSQIEGLNAEQARRAIRNIAGFQGHFWDAVDEPSLSACGPFLSTRESRIMQTLYLLTLPVVFERFGGVFTTAARRQAEAFGTRIVTHFAAVATGPKTIVHGDYRVDNMMFEGENQDGVAVIDWQGCGIGPGLYDVAYFLGSSVATGERRRIERDMVDEYHDIVCRMGARNLTREDCWNSYRQNMLGTLMPMVIGCGALDMSDPGIANQSRELLGRVLTAIEDLDSWEFMPPREPFLGKGWCFATLSRCAYPPYRLALGLLRRGKRAG